MLRKLVAAALPAVAHRHTTGVGLRTLGILYGCNPEWLRDQLSASGYAVRSLDEAIMRHVESTPWEAILISGRTVRP
ncbi:hypothetical protein [Kitasatospora sp. NPDC058046]|uniref:hypothetical protein n=1 Tax=Kitasatospora sp. NPDC058046 TaxID=3346312 RepID=UPI0036DCCC3F